MELQESLVTSVWTDMKEIPPQRAAILDRRDHVDAILEEVSDHPVQEDVVNAM